MIYGNKQYPPYRALWPTPADISLETTCVTISLPADPAWIGLWIGVLLALTDEENFQAFNGAISRETTAEIFREALFDALLLSEVSCELVQSPYWDDETDNEVEMSDDTQIWYGQVTDWLAPIATLNFEQNLAVWLLTGFVGYAAGLGSAVFFRTAAKRFVLAFESGSVEEIIRIVIDSASFNVVIPADSGIVEVVVLGDDALAQHDLYVIQGEA